VLDARAAVTLDSGPDGRYATERDARAEQPVEAEPENRSRREEREHGTAHSAQIAADGEGVAEREHERDEARVMQPAPAALSDPAPGASSYRPVPVALGVVGCELAVVIVVSFSLRRRIGIRNWRRLHWLTYAVFAAATVHGIAAGTDSARGWAIDLYLAAIASVVFATAWRALAVSVPERRT
jgi:branched-subunit amino acid transport protein